MSTKNSTKKYSSVFAALDLETTGFHVNSDKIIEIGIVKFLISKSGELKITSKFSQLINPRQEVPEVVQTITGIKIEDLENQPLMESQVPLIKEFLKDVDYIVGHNVDFDLSFLLEHMEINIPSIDSQFFAELFLPGLPSYSLDVIPYELNIERGNAHRAFDDAVVSAKLFLYTLKQFSALKCRQQVLEILSAAKIIEAKILSGVDFDGTAKIFLPSQPRHDAATCNDESVEVLAKKIKRNERSLVLHTAGNNLSASVSAVISKLDKPLLIATKTRDEAISIAKASYFSFWQNNICVDKVQNVSLKKNICRPEATLAAKILIAQEINKNLWPKLDLEEKNVLPQFFVDQEICKDHKHAKHETNSATSTALTHGDFWRANKNVFGDKKMLLLDFDDAFSALAATLEKRFYHKSILNLLEGLPEMSSLPNFKLENSSGRQELPLGPKGGSTGLQKTLEDLRNKNDLFWGLLNITYLPILEEQKTSTLYITPNLQSEPEFKKVVKSAKDLISKLEALAEKLRSVEDEYLHAYLNHFAEVLETWKLLTAGAPGYHIYFDNFSGELFIKCAADNKTIRVEFLKHLPKTTILTAALGGQNLINHYLNILELHDWEQTKLITDVASRKNLKVAVGTPKPLESIVKIIAQEESKRTVVVAKNSREADLIAQHVGLSFPDKTICAVDKSGGGGSKAVYKFRHSNDAVLVIPPRGRVLDAIWPEYDLAIISSITFGAPEAHTGFMDGALPKGVLAWKTLIAKVLKHAGPKFSLYLIDGRLSSQNYGQNFVDLAEELCGGPAEKVLL